MWMLFNDEESEAVTELYKSSDRAAAIMAATIVESRLTAALKNRFRPNIDVQNEMFRSSGPLGSFSAKIKLGCLLGVCSDQAFSDLEIMKNIRNRFAHYLDIKDFQSQRIADWCKNFKLIESCVVSEGTKEAPVDTYFTVPGRDEKMKDPKWRYLLTAMLFSGALATPRSHGRPNI
jgi:DNA-binding MltR family transcriptional regulator